MKMPRDQSLPALGKDIKKKRELQQTSLGSGMRLSGKNPQTAESSQFSRVCKLKMKGFCILGTKNNW
jgi:hypothetical protein